ncbi:MAG: hypothetical protein IT486_06285 [Gammaproteobacteria bacterium]|nr:hypothetical protein [Gammaproteobacteria bacterium]
MSTAAAVFTVTFMSIGVNTNWGRLTIAQLGSAMRDLLTYSVPRMGAALLLIALTLLPASMAATTAGLDAAGLVALALSVVGIAATASAPIQVVLLPTASVMWADGRQSQLLANFRKMEMIVGVLGVMAAVLMPVVAPYISVVILGAEDPLLRRVLIISAVAIGPFVYFVCGRQVVDACTVRPLNTYNLVMALIAFLAFVAILRWLGLPEVDVIIGSYVLAVVVLAASTRIVIYRLFSLQGQTMPSGP